MLVVALGRVALTGTQCSMHYVNEAFMDRAEPTEFQCRSSHSDGRGTQLVKYQRAS